MATFKSNVQLQKKNANDVRHYGIALILKDIETYRKYVNYANKHKYHKGMIKELKRQISTKINFMYDVGLLNYAEKNEMEAHLTVESEEGL